MPQVISSKRIRSRSLAEYKTKNSIFNKYDHSKVTFQFFFSKITHYLLEHISKYLYLYTFIRRVLQTVNQDLVTHAFNVLHLIVLIQYCYYYIALTLYYTY